MPFSSIVSIFGRLLRGPRGLAIMILALGLLSMAAPANAAKPHHARARAAKVGAPMLSAEIPYAVVAQLQDSAVTDQHRMDILLKSNVTTATAGLLELGSRPRKAFLFCLTMDGETTQQFFSGPNFKSIPWMVECDTAIVLWLDDTENASHQIKCVQHADGFRNGALQDLSVLHGVAGKFAGTLASDPDSGSSWTISTQVCPIKEIPSKLTFTFTHSSSGANDDGSGKTARPYGPAAAIDGEVDSGLPRELPTTDYVRQWFAFGLAGSWSSTNRRLVDVQPNDVTKLVVHREIAKTWKSNLMLIAILQQHHEIAWPEPFKFWTASGWDGFSRRFSLQTGVGLSNRPFDVFFAGGGFSINDGLDLVVGSAWTRTSAPRNPVAVPLSAISQYADLDVRLGHRYEPQWFFGFTVRGHALKDAGL
jgi:hypothetical protein